MVKQTGKNAEKTASCDITKLSLDNQPITAIYKDKEHHCQPVFRTLQECYQPIKQKNVFYISHKRPHSGKLTVGIQVEKDLRDAPNHDKKHHSPKRTNTTGWNNGGNPGATQSSSNHHKKVKPGWSLPDQNLLRLIIEFVYNKLEILTCGIESREKAKEANECVMMAIDIGKRRTYKQLIEGMKHSICRIFCYSEVALLFYDDACKN